RQYPSRVFERSPQENTSTERHFWPVFAQWPSCVRQQWHVVCGGFRPGRLGGARHACAVAGAGFLQPTIRLCATRFFGEGLRGGNAPVPERRSSGRRGHRGMVGQGGQDSTAAGETRPL